MEYYGAPSSQFFPRALFVLSLCVSLIIPSVPVLLFIHHSSWVIWILAGCLVSGVANLVQIGTRRARPLTNLEKLLVVVAQLFSTSAVAFVVAMGFVVVKLLSAALGTGNIAVRVLWYVAIGSACFFLLGSLVTVGPALLEAFFPKTGVGNASLFPGFTWRKIIPLGLLGVAGIAVLVVLVHLGWSYLYIAMLLVLIVASAPVSTAFDRQKQSPTNPPAFEAVKALLVTSGYTMFDRLQTGDLSLDRLIAVFDMVAHKDSSALAIQFKTSASRSEPVTWAEASSLRTAVWAIYQSAEKQKVKVKSILPVLVLFGRKADPSLTEFAERESIGLVVLPSDAPLERIAKGEFPPEQMREFARRYLQVGANADNKGQAFSGFASESRA